jgi:heat shock protein HslJ
VTAIVRPVPTGSDANFVHTQETPSASWTVAHNLGKRPAVQVVDSAGTQVEGDVTWLSENTVRIDFTAAFSGAAYCN